MTLETDIKGKENTHFQVERYGVSVNPEQVSGLSDLVRSASASHSGKYVARDIEGVLGYLGRFDPSNLSEGRDAAVVKTSFSSSELSYAIKLPEDKRVPYLVYRFRFNEYPRNKIVSEFPTVLAVEPTSVCNLRCVMCFQADKTFSSDRAQMGYMSMDLYRRIIDESSKHGLPSLILASRGEPLLHKEFPDMVEYAKKKGILDIKMNTNATKLTPDISRRLLAAEPNLIVYSVDSANKEEFERIRVRADFDQIVDNIKSFNEIRKKEFPDSKVRTRVSMVVLDGDKGYVQDVAGAKTFWQGLVDEFAANKVTNRLDLYNLANSPVDRHCSLLWERMYIWFDGGVNPCDEDYKSSLLLGKVDANTSIESIWNGDKMSEYRAKHGKGMKNSMSPCNHCPGF